MNLLVVDQESAAAQSHLVSALPASDGGGAYGPIASRIVTLHICCSVAQGKLIRTSRTPRERDQVEFLPKN